MGSNVGTTVTSWILSLSGLQGDSFFIRLLNPSGFSPILAPVSYTHLYRDFLYTCRARGQNLAMEVRTHQLHAQGFASLEAAEAALS